MAKPNPYTPDIKDKASVEFNKRLEESKGIKEPKEVKDRIFNLVDKVFLQKA